MAEPVHRHPDRPGRVRTVTAGYLPEFLAQAEQLGFSLDGHTGHGHPRLRNGNGDSVVIARTPSDFRSRRNALALLERLSGRKLPRSNSGKHRHRRQTQLDTTLSPTEKVASEQVDALVAEADSLRRRFAETSCGTVPRVGGRGAESAGPPRTSTSAAAATASHRRPDRSHNVIKAERDQLTRLARLRAKQAEREAEAREKILLAEVIDLMTAEFEAHDRLWADAVVIAEEAMAKANAQIAAQCAELGIPAKDAPGLELRWHARSSEFSNRSRRAELRKMAEVRLAALTKTAKAAIQDRALEVETTLIVGALESAEAVAFANSMPTVEQLMPALQLEDLGVVRWQPPDDIAAQLTTPMTPAQRRRRQILRAIEANPGASDRAIAQLAGCDHKTVATYRRERGEFPAIAGDSPTPGTDDGERGDKP